MNTDDTTQYNKLYTNFFELVSKIANEDRNYYNICRRIQCFQEEIEKNVDNNNRIQRLKFNIFVLQSFINEHHTTTIHDSRGSQPRYY